MTPDKVLTREEAQNMKITELRALISDRYDCKKCKLNHWQGSAIFKSHKKHQGVYVYAPARII